MTSRSLEPQQNMVADWLQSLGTVGSDLLEGAGGWGGGVAKFWKNALVKLRFEAHFIKLVRIIFLEVIKTIKQNLWQIFFSVRPKQNSKNTNKKKYRKNFFLQQKGNVCQPVVSSINRPIVQ